MADQNWNYPQAHNGAPYYGPNPYGQQYPAMPPAPGAPYAPYYAQSQSQAVSPNGYGQPQQAAPYAPQGYYAPQPYYASAPAYSGSTPESGKATAALVCGIISIVFASSLFGIIPGIIAIVLGNQHIKAYGKTGVAFAGKVTGIIGTILSVLMILLVIAYVAFIFFLVATYSFSSYPANPDWYYSSTDLMTYVSSLF